MPKLTRVGLRAYRDRRIWRGMVFWRALGLGRELPVSCAALAKRSGRAGARSPVPAREFSCETRRPKSGLARHGGWAMPCAVGWSNSRSGEAVSGCREALLDKPAVAPGITVARRQWQPAVDARHCWTSQQWQPADRTFDWPPVRICEHCEMGVRPCRKQLLREKAGVSQRTINLVLPHCWTSPQWHPARRVRRIAKSPSGLAGFLRDYSRQWARSRLAETATLTSSSKGSMPTPKPVGRVFDAPQ